MSRLSREEQAEYEAEMEYQRNQPVEISERHKPSTMDRIVSAAKGAARAVGSAPAAAAQKAQQFDSGPTGKAIRGFAERVNAQQGLGGAGGAPPQSARAMRQQPQVQVNPGSTLHPGTKIYVMEGTLLASGGRPPAGQRRPRAARRGGLGQSDNGFDNDHGL
jgi:hypothetical protein